MLLWRPKRNYFCLHHSLALGSREFTLDFQGISDFFQTFRVSEVALDKAVEENSFDFIPALVSTDPGPLKCGHQCNYVLASCTPTDSHLESIKQTSATALPVAQETGY